MMIQTPHAITGMLLALSGIACPAPDTPQAPPKPPCEADVILLASFEHETDCDVTPPQTIVVRLDDPGDAQMHECDDAGGQVLIDPQNRSEYCINIDY